MYDRIFIEWAEQRGFKVGKGEIDLLDRAIKELEQQKAAHEIDSFFFKENLCFSNDFINVNMNQNQSLIIVAVPRPAHIVGFSFDKKIINMVLPPTYVDYRSIFANVRRDLEKHVFSEQVELKTLSAPLKSLASNLGVVSYGKNNLTYVPEFGSYFQLVGYLVNTPFLHKKSAENNKRTFMQECSNCSACSKVCPMNAISSDRFLLHAEKCYTLHSESSRLLPDEIRPPSPNCLIGCMKCQEICPMNKGKLKFENTGILFSSKETLAILDSDKMTVSLLEKIESKFTALGLSESTKIFFRNFKNFMRIKGTIKGNA